MCSSLPLPKRCKSGLNQFEPELTVHRIGTWQRSDLAARRSAAAVWSARPRALAVP